jgi:hypothetical protein
MDAISELKEQAKRAWSTFGSVERAERNVSIDKFARSVSGNAPRRFFGLWAMGATPATEGAPNCRR